MNFLAIFIIIGVSFFSSSANAQHYVDFSALNSACNSALTPKTCPSSDPAAEFICETTNSVILQGNSNCQFTANSLAAIDGYLYSAGFIRGDDGNAGFDCSGNPPGIDPVDFKSECLFVQVGVSYSEAANASIISCDARDPYSTGMTVSCHGAPGVGAGVYYYAITQKFPGKSGSGTVRVTSSGLRGTRTVNIPIVW